MTSAQSSEMLLSVKSWSCADRHSTTQCHIAHTMAQYDDVVDDDDDARLPAHNPKLIPELFGEADD